MIVPLVGLFVAVGIFACIGAALLALVIGSVPTCAITAVAYGRVFGDVNGELRPVAVLGLFASLLVAGVFGMAHANDPFAERLWQPSQSTIVEIMLALIY